MTVTTNKALSLPLVGGESATWGTDVNNNVITPLDLMLGGVGSVALSSTNYTIGTNSASEVQDVMIKLTGTLLANVIVSSPNIGFYFVENNTTGAFSVTWQANFGSGNVGSGLVIPQGQRILLVSDTSAGVRRGDTSSIPSGTVTDFFQAAAPVGWTQNGSFNDVLTRVVSGAGGGSFTGGNAFSTASAAGTIGGHAITQAELPSYNLNVTDPGHTHDGVVSVTSGGGAFTGSSGFHSNQISGSSTTGITVASGGSNNTHTHSFSGSSLSINYINMIVCSKN